MWLEEETDEDADVMNILMVLIVNFWWKTFVLQKPQNTTLDIVFYRHDTTKYNSWCCVLYT